MKDPDAIRIAVALSGGGHRASMFGLGVLLALVDLRLNRQVRQVASVSGGSITNGFIAVLPTRFSDYTSDTFYHAVRPFVTQVVTRGLLTSKVIAAVILLAALPALMGTAAAIWLVVSGRSGPLHAVLIAFLALLVTLRVALGRGLALEILLTRRVLSLGRTRKSAVRFSDLPTQSDDDHVEHVFCATDLASGQPFYFSTWQSGLAFLRKVPDFLTDTWGPGHEVSPCGSVAVALAVRASATLPPWIPPRMLSLSNMRSVALSDGGVWNNLGTQCLLEDRLFHGTRFSHSATTSPDEAVTTAWDDLPPARPNVLIVANASASDEPVSAWPFRVPLWAELRANIRAISIGNTSTVEPRVAAARERLQTRVAAGQAISNGVLPIPIDIWKLARDTHTLISGPTPFDSDLNQLDPASIDVKIGTTLKPIGAAAARALLARAYVNTVVAAATLDCSLPVPVDTVKKRLEFLVNDKAEWSG